MLGEWNKIEINRFEVKGKGALVKSMEDYSSVIDSLITCKLISHLL